MGRNYDEYNNDEPIIINSGGIDLGSGRKDHNNVSCTKIYCILLLLVPLIVAIIMLIFLSVL